MFFVTFCYSKHGVILNSYHCVDEIKTVKTKNTGIAENKQIDMMLRFQRK